LCNIISTGLSDFVGSGVGGGASAIVFSQGMGFTAVLEVERPRSRKLHRSCSICAASFASMALLLDNAVQCENIFSSSQESRPSNEKNSRSLLTPTNAGYHCNPDVYRESPRRDGGKSGKEERR
jgi:hypothetical protein